MGGTKIYKTTQPKKNPSLVHCNRKVVIASLFPNERCSHFEAPRLKSDIKTSCNISLYRLFMVPIAFLKPKAHVEKAPPSKVSLPDKTCVAVHCVKRPRVPPQSSSFPGTEAMSRRRVSVRSDNKFKLIN